MQTAPAKGQSVFDTGIVTRAANTTTARERNTLTACERRDAKNERKNKRRRKGGRT